MSQGCGLSVNKVWCSCTGLQTTEKTTNEAVLDILFSKSDLQKMFHTVYTLNKEIGHLVSYSTSIQ